MLTWLIFAVIGKLLIYLWMKFPLPQWSKTLGELHQCDLCSGFWIYSILAFCLGVDIFQAEFGYTVEVVGSLITGAVTSFVVHIFSIGWREKYSQPIII